MATLPLCANPPDEVQKLTFRTSSRGCVVSLAVMPGKEDFYGLGLQFKSFCQTGKKKIMRVNADPAYDLGDTHAPVPFVVSTAGWGLYVDTARYAVFYCGNAVEAGGGGPRLLVDIPTARGVDLYFFGGPTPREAVQRYNLFSGGGILPPLWGLGMYYRAEVHYSAEKALALAKTFRERNLPFDVFGLEPGWQTRVYPCSYIWNPERFPDPPEFVARMKNLGFQINLWQHVFVHPESPVYEDLRDKSGDFTVWGGLVPDLAFPPARERFTRHQEQVQVDAGVSGFKLDECDNSDFTGGWSFPECSRFPSGLDGEQMHSLIGVLYQRAMNTLFTRRNLRTYGLVRSSHAMAAPLPFVLYSDLYDHADYVRALVNCGFSGLLWTPEVRSCNSVTDLFRRVETVVFSPLAQIDAWYIEQPPWMEFDRDRNNRGEQMPNWEEVESVCRELFQWRMRLIPYLYAAFARYYEEGLPPFRALVLDYPDDPAVREIDSQYMMGDVLLVAPMIGEVASRKVYLPSGNWYDFWTGEKHAGKATLEVSPPPGRIPVYVRENTLLPLAEPVDYIAVDTVFNLTVRAYGSDPQPFTLWEDDGQTLDYQKGARNRVVLAWPHKVKRHGDYPNIRYRVIKWERIK